MTIVVFILTAASRLVKAGNCRIVINRDESKALSVKAGTNLLSALASQSVFLPSACGGGGTCAECKCQIFEGGGDILPTETTHIGKKEQKDHWRLACQVKVKEDMKIGVPEEVFSIQKFTCTVKSNRNVATFIKELDLDIDEGRVLDFKAGQYVQLYVPPYEGLDFHSFHIEEDYRDEWDRYDLWKYTAHNDEECYRAYSMANHPAEGNRLMLNIRIATPPPARDDIPPGIVSSYTFALNPSDKVEVSGPYGDFLIKETKREKIYIGGGAGMAPMRSHLFHLFHTLQVKDVKISFWYGARSKREMFYNEEFEEIARKFPNFQFHVALSSPLPEDHWEGLTGFIHQVTYDHYLKFHPEPEECEYYLCGPPLMIAAVTKMLHDLGVEDEMISYDIF